MEANVQRGRVFISETKELGSRAALQREKEHLAHLKQMSMQKASGAKASAEDNNMFLLDHFSFYERKTRRFGKYFLCTKRVQGDICFGLTSTQNHLNTQHMRKRAKKSSLCLKRLLMPIPNKATEQACFLLPLQKSLQTQTQTPEDVIMIADSRIRLFYLPFLSRGFFDFQQIRNPNPNSLYLFQKKNNCQTMVKSSKVWFIYIALNHKFVSGGLQIMVHSAQQ